MHFLTKTTMPCWIWVILVGMLSCSAHLVTSQQSYSPYVCGNSTSAVGYSCNGLKKRCRTYLLFRAQPPYNNASSIATLFGSDPSKIARLNNISETAVLVTRKEVIVPINCSCSGSYYQSNTSYVVRVNDTPYLIANSTFEGATTCKAIKNQRSGLVDDIFPDETLTIPLRCACPTKNQTRAGVKYLMTYVIKSGDTISTISLRFGARDIGETLVANEKSVQDSIIQPFTTLVIPLRSPPNSSMTTTPKNSSLPQTPQPSPPPIILPASTTPSTRTKKWNYFLYGLIAGGGFVTLFSAIAFSLLLAQRSNTRATGKVVSNETPAPGPSPSPCPCPDLELLSKVAQSLRVFDFEELESATDGFSPASLISGTVYRGIIVDDGLEPRQVAIKKTQGDVSREMETLNKINHFNIIKLLGVCYNNNNGAWYLVYEYASNGRLSDFIYHTPSICLGREDCVTLSWEKRVQIALDVATGLDYLHAYTHPPLIHMDLKSTHVLLDEELRAKISHFGLSRPVGGEEAAAAAHFALTNHIVGTKGYMAPEYLQNGLVTPEMDVYAFGILILEILTGKEAAHSTLPLDNKRLREVMDPSLQDKYPVDVATAFLTLADKCVSKEAGERPAMDDVVRMLSKALTSSTSTISSLATTTNNSAE